MASASRAAASLVNVGTTLYGSSSDHQQEVTEAVGVTGASVDTQVEAKVERKLWLRTD